MLLCRSGSDKIPVAARIVVFALSPILQLTTMDVASQQFVVPQIKEFGSQGHDSYLLPVVNCKSGAEIMLINLVNFK